MWGRNGLRLFRVLLEDLLENPVVQGVSVGHLVSRVCVPEPRIIMETEVRRSQDESPKDDSEVETAIIVWNSFRMNFKNGAMETESKFCTRSPSVRHRTAISNDLTDRTEDWLMRTG